MPPLNIHTASGLLTAYCAVRPRLMEAITDSLAGQPRARSYDESERPAPVPWCWDHERPVTLCHRVDLLCDGETIAAADPTGEAAVAYDQGRAHQSEVERLEAEVVAALARLDSIRAYYLPRTLPTGAERAKLATAGEPGCFFCAQARTWSPPHTKTPTTVGGNLKVARLVCSGHYDLIRKHLGRAPSKQENEAYVRHGKYPKRVA